MSISKIREIGDKDAQNQCGRTEFDFELQSSLKRRVKKEKVFRRLISKRDYESLYQI